MPASASSAPKSPSLSESNVRFLESIIDHIARPIFVKNRAFEFVLVNRALCALIGRDTTEIVGATDFDFFPKDEADFFRAADKSVFDSGKAVNVTTEFITDASGGRHAVTTHKVPLCDDSGEVTHLVGVMHDITEHQREKTSLERTNELLQGRILESKDALTAAQGELVRKERLAVLGQLAGGLAHQIRNPLGAIANAAYHLQRVLAGHADPDVGRALKIIQDETWQANRIITDLLDYARVRPASLRPAMINEIIEDALGRENWPHAIDIEHATSKLSAVAIDVDQVRDAFQNLFANAIEAMPDGGTLSVTGKVAGDHARIEVSDSGHGIDKELVGKLFEPLVSTKPLGLGLGLTTARALIENQGGSLLCEQFASPTRFVVLLPFAK